MAKYSTQGRRKSANIVDRRFETGTTTAENTIKGLKQDNLTDVISATQMIEGKRIQKSVRRAATDPNWTGKVK